MFAENFQKNSKKYLTNRKICDIILKLLRMTATVTEKLQKNFLKKFKKDLTSLKKCDIMNKSLDKD